MGDGDNEAIPVAERVYMCRPGCSVILISEQINVEIYQQAIRAGVKNVMQWPVPQKELIENIKLAANLEKMRNSTAGPGANNMSWGSKVITVFGTKGGIGKTTLAVNLAVKLSENKKKVALIDLDLQFGDVNVFLDMEPKDTLSELVQDNNSFDIDTIKNYMVLHSSGTNVLCSPKSPEYAETITPSHIERIINTIRPYYDYIIIDTPPVFNECTLTAIEVSSKVMFVIALDISTLRNAKISMNVLESLQQIEKVNLIVNREVESIITVNDAEKIMGVKILARIPADWKTATAALNKGVPFVSGYPNAKLSNVVSELARKL
jgi:pilus assembly protein CpaE